MPKPNDLSKCLAALEQDSTVIAVIELGLKSWLVAGIVPGVIHPTSVSVTREHRRAKSDRLDTKHLKRAFIGWLRGETDHCRMAAIPTVEEEDAKRPNRERESLVGQRTRIVNRLKSCFVRFGIRGFNPKLRKAPERLAALRTPEGTPMPPNTLDEVKRDMARLRFISDQINEIEKARLIRLQAAPKTGPNASTMVVAPVLRMGPPPRSFPQFSGLAPAEPFPRPGRSIRALARAAAVKDGALAPHRRLVLDGGEHDGTVGRHGARAQHAHPLIASPGMRHQSSDNVQVRTLRRRYSSSRNP
jgi:transposase